MANDDFYNARKKARKIGNRIEQKAILIATEDEKSSRYYFESLIKDKGLRGQVILADHVGSNPKNVLKAIFAHKSSDKYEKKWIVIDRDEHIKDDYKGTIEEARTKNICVAFSNESYELWILLHFEEVNANVSRVDLNHRLNKIFRDRFGKEYKKASADIYGFIIGQQQTAILNAKKLVAQHHRDCGKIDIEKNPITMIYELIECLNSISSQKIDCKCYPADGKQSSDA